ncbi:IS3 family transposase [Deinococcus caeni]|uniref:IS3 family transposase n=1 Tax=Deinococcus caeni TaxID=569127 RepID=UPI003615FA68
MRQLFGISERRACRVLGFHRSTQRHRATRDDRDLADKLRTLARERPRFGYRRLHILLRRQGETVNHKRVYRVYRNEGLAVRKKTRRKGWHTPDCRSRRRPGPTSDGAWTSSVISWPTGNGSES